MSQKTILSILHSSKDNSHFFAFFFTVNVPLNYMHVSRRNFYSGENFTANKDLAGLTKFMRRNKMLQCLCDHHIKVK